jgi:rhamnulokinase
VAILLIPDLFNYWLSGRRVAELTIASTTGVPLSLLQPLVAPGTSLGSMTEQVRKSRWSAWCRTIRRPRCWRSRQQQNFAYISCGTWGLVDQLKASRCSGLRGRVGNPFVMR